MVCFELMEKVKEFWNRYLEIKSNEQEYAPIDFMTLLVHYPVSLFKRDMSDCLKLLIALMYHGTKPNPPEENQVWEGYSYEDLALIFVRSKASIHDAMKQKETEAKAMLQEASLRDQAKKIALKELIEEEKQKLRESKEKSTKELTKQTNEHV